MARRPTFVLMSRESIRSIVISDLLFRSPLWALLILVIWGAIAYGMIWLLLNVVKPSVDKKIERRAAAQIGMHDRI